MSGQALITSPFGVGAVVTTLIALTFWRDRRFRLFSFLGTARHGGDHEVVVLWSSAHLEPSPGRHNYPGSPPDRSDWLHGDGSAE